MKPSIETIIVRPEDAIGDTLIITRLLKSLSQTFPKIKIVASVDKSKQDLLKGILKINGGFVNGGGLSAIVERDYIPTSRELLLDFEGYLNENQALRGENYSNSTFRLSEKILRDFGINIPLRRDVLNEVRFDNVAEFSEHIEMGKRRVEKIKRKHGEKPIIWLGTRTAGSTNRMPQNYVHQQNFWRELVKELKEDYTFYELLGSKDEPFSNGVEHGEGNFHFAFSSEILRACTAGIGLDGMQIELAHALGNSKMVILLGPTHPRAVIYPDFEEHMLTIPSVVDFEKLNYCRACGMVGYSNWTSHQEKVSIMRTRYQGFELDSAMECRKLKKREDKYDCWKNLDVKEIKNKLTNLLI
jgi:hypothetical protein